MSLSPSPPALALARRRRVRIRGAIQGVGFRPFIDRLARANGLGGWVRNDADGVLVEIEGERTEAFLDTLQAGAPPLARITQVEVSELAPIGVAAFEIRASAGGDVRTVLPPDQPVCSDCLAELFDPADRRHLYPFINCTQCGPRFTLVHRLPYDRANTSMSGFPLCPPCAAEYADRGDRRFHAEPTACPVCGPRLSHPIRRILERLRIGEIVALKGLGGFHLACDAKDERSVARLRRRKDRDAKPFALMAANVASVRRWAHCDAGEAALLESGPHPIVVLRSRGRGLAPGIAPGLPSLGFLLPTTPIHHLLFHAAAGSPSGVGWVEAPQDLVLVMTSANPGGEPLVTDDGEAHRRLAGIADCIVGHDREIVTRADDSVVRVVNGAPAFIRRARGYVPEPIELARALPPILAVGGHLKNTLCVTRGDEAFVSQHVGSLDNPEAIRFFEETAEHLLRLLDVRPEIVAHDLHPDFASTRYARARGLPTLAVQHHLAHIAAVAAEHRVDGAVLGLALDGFGLGPDAESWGGELLWLKGARWRRLGHLRELLQPGGDAAATQPWRMGAAALFELGRGAEIAARFPDEKGAALIAEMLHRRVHSPPTSSCGRLFDAACGLLHVVPRASFEGQAPMVLEGLVESPRILDGGWRLHDGVLDLRPTLAHLVGCTPRAGAEIFHGTLIAALGDWVRAAAAQTGAVEVVLSGGCLLNQVLAGGLAGELERSGLTALLPGRLPPNDGAVSLGQAWVAGLLCAGEDPVADGARPCV
jgi:hydrogenase maturation protein HypF